MAAGLATFLSTDRELALGWFLVIPLPSFVFAFLVLREDFLMADHELYYYKLRARILERVGAPVADPMLRFLSDMKTVKIGSWFTILSGLRYAPPAIVVLASVGWFLLNAQVTLTAEGVFNFCALMANVILFGLLLLGIWRLGRAHNAASMRAPVLENAGG